MHSDSLVLGPHHPGESPDSPGQSLHLSSVVVRSVVCQSGNCCHASSDFIFQIYKCFISTTFYKISDKQMDIKIGVYFYFYSSSYSFRIFGRAQRAPPLSPMGPTVAAKALCRSNFSSIISRVRCTQTAWSWALTTQERANVALGRTCTCHQWWSGRWSVSQAMVGTYYIASTTRHIAELIPSLIVAV